MVLICQLYGIMFPMYLQRFLSSIPTDGRSPEIERTYQMPHGSVISVTRSAHQLYPLTPSQETRVLTPGDDPVTEDVGGTVTHFVLTSPDQVDPNTTLSYSGLSTKYFAFSLPASFAQIITDQDRGLLSRQRAEVHGGTDPLADNPNQAQLEFVRVAKQALVRSLAHRAEEIFEIQSDLNSRARRRRGITWAVICAAGLQIGAVTTALWTTELPNTGAAYDTYAPILAGGVGCALAYNLMRRRRDFANGRSFVEMISATQDAAEIRNDILAAFGPPPSETPPSIQ